MKTSLIIAFLAALILIGTNPGLEDHRSAVSKKALELVGEETGQNEWQKLGSEIGKRIGGAIIEKMVERNNFILFSLGRITFMEKSKIVSVGVLGNVIVLKNWNDDGGMSVEGAAKTSDALSNLNWKKPASVMEEVRNSYSIIRQNLSRFTIAESNADYITYILELPEYNIQYTETGGVGRLLFEVQESLQSIINFYTSLGFEYYEGTYSDYLQNSIDNYCVTIKKDIFNNGEPLKISFYSSSCDEMMVME